MSNISTILNHSADGVDRKALKDLRQRFLVINEGRLKRVFHVLNNAQRTFLEALPLMLHVNHPLLPGYVSNNTPCGICNFEPTKDHIRAARSLAKTFSCNGRQARQHGAIHNLSAMGSPGTIAHSRSSDMDFWVCHDPSLKEEQLVELEQKLNGIQKWAESLGLEIYFFLMDVNQFRQGQRKSGVSGEDCGSAQHYLLLDEFYRTSVLFAGRYPIWWLVPGEKEKNYTDYVHMLLTQRFVQQDECIDFGGIPVFPAGEFIGAGMWQLYKGIDSPYKSVLKIMVTEVYASEYPNVSGLSLLFKKAVQAGSSDLDELDPYTMLYKKLEAYLVARNEPDRLELLRRCLYFKINEPMSRSPRSAVSWRRHSVAKLMSHWNWSQDYLKMLDARKEWKVHQVIHERKVLVDELNFSYRFLSRFAKENSFSVLINEQDMNILGRKLYAAFERKSGKIEFINPNIAPNVREDQVTIFQQASNVSGKNSVWVIYGGIIKPEECEQFEPIKRSRSIVELLAWCYFNNLIDGATRIILYPGDSALSEQELRQIITSFVSLYPDGMGMAEQQQFNFVAKPKQITLYINVGVDPMSDLNRKGIQRLTDHTDAFSYSGMHENLVLSIEQIVMNTWHEVMTAYFDLSDAIVNCILDFLRTMPRAKLTEFPKLNILCFCLSRPGAIASRVEELFKSMISCFYREGATGNIRYVLEISSEYFVFQFKGSQPTVAKLKSYAALVRHLGLPQETFSKIVFDPYALRREVLSFIARHNKKDQVQVFYVKKGGQGADIYVLDEKGSVTAFFEADFQEKNSLRRLLRFIRSIKYRQSSGVAEEESSKIGMDIKFHEVIKNGGFHLEQRVVSMQLESERRHKVQVIVEETDDNNYVDKKYVYTIFCDHIEFSEYEYGQDIFNAVARHLLSHREGEGRYPVYITDLDLTGLSKSDEVLQTCLYLQQKLALENLLNRALSLL